MNNENLIWEYFWEQKTEEFSAIFSILFFIIVIGIALPLALGNSIGDGMAEGCSGVFSQNEETYRCTIADTWGEGWVYMILFFLPILIIYLWIDSNWDKAKRKARWKLEEIERSKRKKRRKKK